MRRRDVLAGPAATSLFAGIRGVGAAPTPGTPHLLVPPVASAREIPGGPADAAWEEPSRQVKGGS
jgi:hypothetical protein